jgi:acetylornithine deacetylase/succinyl-diaminopimelate desuccinylase-like protein
MRLLVRFLPAAAIAWLAWGATAAPVPSDAEKVQARAVFRAIIEMDTSVEGLKTPEMAAYLARVFREAGFPERDIHVLPFGKTASFVVRYRGREAGARGIGFPAHMDVVTARREDWERDPFKLVEEKGYFFGRGTSDNKNGIATLVGTFLQLKKENFVPSPDLVLIFTGDEETAGLTATSLVQEHRALIDVEYIINSDAGGGTLSEQGRATAYTLQTAEKTFASFRLTARNGGGHSSQPRKDNAIYDVMRAVQAIERHAFPVMWNDTTLAGSQKPSGN